MHRSAKLRSLVPGAVALLAGTVLSEVPTSGAVVFSASNALKSAGPSRLVLISGGQAGPAKVLTSQNGKNYRISPDGRYVAFDDGGSVYVCWLKENAPASKVSAGAHPAWVEKSDGFYLFFSSQSCKCSFGTGNSYLQKIDLASLKLVGGKVEIKYNGQSSVMMGGMGTNGRYACTGYPDCTIAEAGGTKVTKIGGAQRCNPSIAPTTGRMMILDDTGHKTFAVYDINGNAVKRWGPGGYVQNPEWSTHEEWCSWVQGNSTGDNVYVGRIGTSGTRVYTGPATFPHLYVGTVVPPKPGLSVSPSVLDFDYTIGKAVPASRTVGVTVSSGTISGLTATENVGWLTASVSGTSIGNAINVAGLAENTYTTTVVVSASGADNATYTVNLNVMQEPVLTTIAVSPSPAHVAPGGTLQLSAKAKDQFGRDLAAQPLFTWEATGAGTVTGTGLFTAVAAEGSATVTARAGGTSGSAAVTVAAAPPVNVKINCGGSATGEWVAEQYSSTGANYSFGGTHDVSGVTNPAPNVVYQTVRHKSPTYQIPASVVTNGTYLVRLHFTDAVGSVGQRKIGVTIEGQKVLSDYDIVAQAGGTNIVAIEEFSVVVSDGNGMTIQLDQGAGNDAFVAGIEIIAGGSPAVREVELLAPRGGESFAIGEVMHIKWKADERVTGEGVQVLFSSDGGKNWIDLYPDRAIDGTMAQWSDYAWTIPGTVTNSDGVAVPTQSGQCRIKIIEYNNTPSDVSGAFSISGETDSVQARRRWVPVSGVSCRVGKGVLGVSIPSGGAHTVTVTSADGRLIARRRGSAAREYALDLPATKGLYLVRIVAAKQTTSHMLVITK